MTKDIPARGPKAKGETKPEEPGPTKPDRTLATETPASDSADIAFIRRVLAARDPSALAELDAGLAEAAKGEAALETWLARKQAEAEAERAKRDREALFGNVLRYILAYPDTGTYFAELGANGRRVPSEAEIDHVRILLFSCDLALGGSEAALLNNQKAYDMITGRDSTPNRLANLVAAFEAAIGHAPDRGKEPPPPDYIIEGVWWLGDPLEILSFLLYLRQIDPAFANADPKKLREQALTQLRKAKPASTVGKGGSGNSGAIHAITELAVKFKAFGCTIKQGETWDAAVTREKMNIRRKVKPQKHRQDV